MAKDFSRKFYSSKQWKECREGYINSVNGLCERCLRDGKITTGYILHHKEHLTPNNINDADVTLNWDNLEYLCKPHHDDIHGVGKKSEVISDGLMFDDDGQLIKM